MFTRQEAIDHINNLIRLADYHKQNCIDPDCSISIFKAGQLARFLADYSLAQDRVELLNLVESFDWY